MMDLRSRAAGKRNPFAAPRNMRSTTLLVFVLVSIRVGGPPFELLAGLLVNAIYPLVALWYLRRPHIAALFR